jgi:hypothetical protein
MKYYEAKGKERVMSQYSHMINKVYYPGSGQDVKALKFILEELKDVHDIVFCDYILHLSEADFEALPDWEILKKKSLFPGDFGRKEWSSFWSKVPGSLQHAEPGQMPSTLWVIYQKSTHRVVRFYQLGTEALGTYDVLIFNDLQPDLIFLADHGFGSNWNANSWGQPSPDSEKQAFLAEIAVDNPFLLVDAESTRPWANYQLRAGAENSRWRFYIHADLIEAE